MTNADKIRIVARFIAFLENTAKEFGVLTGDVKEVIKTYDRLQKEIFGT